MSRILTGAMPFVAAAACVTGVAALAGVFHSPEPAARVPADSIRNASRRSMSVSSGARVTEGAEPTMCRMTTVSEFEHVDYICRH